MAVVTVMEERSEEEGQEEPLKKEMTRWTGKEPVEVEEMEPVVELVEDAVGEG